LVELYVLDDWANNKRESIWLRDEIRVIVSVEGNRYLGPLQVLRGGKSDWHDLLGRNLLLPLGLIGVRSTEDVVDLLTSFREATFWVFCLLLLLDLFGWLENFICEVLQPVAVLSLVLFLMMENVDSI
jgi:hypothetical protein